MATSLPTLATLRQRYQYMRGETDYTTVVATNDSNINQAIWDILNLYDFTWNRTTTTGTISSLAFNLADDYNPTWHISDARIVNPSIGDDYIFREIPVQDRDFFDTNEYVYWLTMTAATGISVFNTNQTAGTVTYTYQYIPVALVNATDVCIIPDAEAVAMFALAKNWVGDERDVALADRYEAMAKARLDALYQKEVAFGALYSENTLIDRQPQINGSGADPGLNIARP
ncbi:MAG: phage adaptor protein [Nitrospiria bacterium]